MCTTWQQTAASLGVFDSGREQSRTADQKPSLPGIPALANSGSRRSKAGTRETCVAGDAREKGWLLDGRKGNYEPLAAIKFHVRIRGAPCVSFFACHVDLPFLLGSVAVDREVHMWFSPSSGVLLPWSCHMPAGETLIQNGLNYPFG